jgi:hypothetical protein
LKPIVASGPFQQWGLDFIGEIHPPSSGHHRWILTTIDYFTKWIEVIPTRSASHKVIIGFLEEIMPRFGCLNRIVIDNDPSFKAEPLVKFCEQFEISLIQSTPYPQQWISRVLQQKPDKDHQNTTRGQQEGMGFKAQICYVV